MKQRFTPILMILSVIMVIGFACKKKVAPVLPLLEIPVFEVVQKQMPVYQEFVGQTYGVMDIAIRARVEGYLVSWHFKEGSEVKKGQLLYTIDPSPFDQQVAAQASMLAESQTMMVKAKSDLDRIEPLAKTGAMSKSDLDAAVANYEAAKAGVEAAKAGLRGSQIQRDYTTVTSPINGVIGITKVKEGDFISRGMSTPLTTVSDMSSVTVRFSITEAEYLYLFRNVENFKNRPEEFKGFKLIMGDGSHFPYKGTIDFVNREVDPTTGTIQLQATFPNPDKMIRPGQFARVRAVMELKDSAVFVPQRCVADLQGQSFVYVVDSQDSIRVRPVKLGSEIGNLYLIEEGLKPKDRVVMEGIQKVKAGTKVKPVSVPYELNKDYIVEFKK